MMACPGTRRLSRKDGKRAWKHRARAAAPALCAAALPALAFAPAVGQLLRAPARLGASAGQGPGSSTRASWARLAAPLALVPLAAIGVRRRARTRAAPSPRTARLASPYPSGVYDVDSARAYFEARPWSVLVRSLELVSSSVGFAASLFLDSRLGVQEQNAAKRAAELTNLLARLGPTFIKIGQALSIRADLLPPAYLIALTELQDRVPPFPTSQADEIIESELGLAVGEIFDDISSEPIASASLGQVYRARLRDGPEVAVKVQRPGMEGVVALDLYLLRLGADPLQWFLRTIGSGLNTDLVGVVDTWGYGFVGELDYMQEAKNAAEFQLAIQETPLRGAVFAPPVVEACSSRKVITSEWIEGERLELSPAEDIGTLCSLAMNTYLTMMLETGTLHADPHLGNLLRTPDGRLCILDWGLVTVLEEDFHVAYIEHIAHLVSGDWAPVPSDLVRLGFVPADKEQDVLKSDVVEVLADVYSQWTSGGGARGMDVNGLFNSINALSDRYGNLFRVPPYFFYIARAFAVLEGIGLSNDPKYSIVSACLPYVSQRLLKDSSPGISRALASFVYGAKKDELDRRMDIRRIDDLAKGLASYTVSSNGLASTPSAGKEAVNLADQIATLLLEDGVDSDAVPGSEEESSAIIRRATPLQDMVLDEVAKVVGAQARTAVANLGLFGGDGAGLKTLLPDEADNEALETVRRLTEQLGPRAQALADRLRALPVEDQREVAGEVLQRLWQYRGNVARTGGRLVRKLVAQGLRRAQADLAATR